MRISHSFDKRIFRSILSVTIIPVLALVLSGCISWNIYTTIESEFLPDGKLNRSGEIALKRHSSDADEERHAIAIDTSNAMQFINNNYIPPENVKFEGYTVNPDSTYSINWSLSIVQPGSTFSDYHRLTSDSLSFSGNNVTATVYHKFFRTDYEYKEVFFDAVLGDSVMKVFPEILPPAVDAYFSYLQRFTPSRSVLNAIDSSKDSTSVILKNYWNKALSKLFFDPDFFDNGDDYFDALQDSTLSEIRLLLLSHPGGSGLPEEIIEKAINEGENTIDEEFRKRNINIWGAYNVIGDNRSLFKITLTFPGRIEATNADSVGDNYLQWNFTNNELRGKEILLYARSSHYNWVRLIISLVGVLIFVLSAVFIAKKVAGSRST
ncbi:MAG: hypothetical protein GY855_09280 [candidate division Zixibacteria bacterium]|nr:hypothetical protein [candidate division Zixibacteria bacterium]